MSKVLKINDGYGNVTLPFRNKFSHLSDIIEIQILDDRISALGMNAVDQCINLSIAVLSSIKHIGVDAFNGCSNLVSLSTSFNDEKYVKSLYREWGISANCSCYMISSLNPIVTTSSLFTFYATPSTCGIENEDGTYSVDEYTMCRTNSTNFISSIEFDNSVIWSKLEPYAFAKCSNIVSVKIPDTVTNIGTNCFYDCRQLSLIVFPVKLSSLGINAFDQIPLSCELSILDTELSNCKSLFEYNLRIIDLYQGGRLHIIGDVFDECKLSLDEDEIEYFYNLFTDKKSDC